MKIYPVFCSFVLPFRSFEVVFVHSERFPTIFTHLWLSSCSGSIYGKDDISFNSTAPYTIISVPHSPDFRCFVVSFRLSRLTLTLFFFPSAALAILGPLKLQMNFRINLLNSTYREGIRDSDIGS